MNIRQVYIIIFVLLITIDNCIAVELGPTWKPVTDFQKFITGKQITNWNKEIIYFILIDRFYNGDPANDTGNNINSHVPFDREKGNFQALKTFQGGDLDGVLQKLGYLDSLGVTTLWLSPVFNNSENGFVGWWSYHGYSPVDFFSVDEHFGSLATLKRLVDLAHQRGIKIILDMILNHVAPDHPWVADSGNWENKGYKHWFHPHSGRDASTSIRDWQDQHELETKELNGLPDFDQDNPNVYNFLLDMSKFWITETNCDGFRIDAVKHIPKSFWTKYNKDIRDFAGQDFLLLGEVFEGSTEYVAGYRELGFTALFDIPMYYTLNRVFAQGAPINLLSEQIAVNKAQYLNNILLFSLLDNHDVARFSYSAGKDVAEKLKPALTFLFTQNGCPVLYYGTEIPLPGAAPENEQTGTGQDYLNRLPMDWEKVYSDSSLLHYIRTISSVRKKSPALQNGRIFELYKDYGVYCYIKYQGVNAVLCVLNNSSKPENRKIPLRGIIQTDQLNITDQLSKRNFEIFGDTLEITLHPYTALLFDLTGLYKPENISGHDWQCEFSPVLTNDYTLIQFTYRSTRLLKNVVIAGDFNGWSSTSDSLTDKNKNGIWEISLPLKSGQYRYKFVLDGNTWIPDPEAAEFELDPYGGKNSVVIVP
ncbi:hypothetical protein JXQ31_13750 [candidate division KSB1 bacterium]|nr:hypothetical protein [candidate division KSB1 bacterium]